jgi:hypothetical protein
MGLGTTDQWVPSHDSIKALLPVAEWPTAVQTVAEMQDTPSRRLLPVPTLGLGTTDQWVPSHDSTKVLKAPLLAVE